MDSSEQKALSNIQEYGCHVIHVLEDDEGPPFAYSVGIQKTSEAPEVIIIGLKQQLAHRLVNEYNDRVRSGESFTPGSFYEGFLDDFKVTFLEVDPKHFREHVGWNLWLYKGSDFKLLQLIFPTTSGVWPWDEAADDWIRERQPLLTANGLLEPP